jgi:hypothetical protein
MVLYKEKQMKEFQWTNRALCAPVRTSAIASSALLWCLLVATSFCLLATGTVSAGIVIGLDDGRMLNATTEDPAVYAVGVAPYGFDPGSLSIQSGAAFPEQFDLHGEYFTNGFPVNGIPIVVNFNIFEEAPFGNEISDTLNIVFTGHSPTINDPSDVSVDLHFRSDIDGGPGLQALANAIAIFEVPGFMQLDIQAAGGPTDFSIAVRSPEPSTFVMLGLGIGSLFACHLRKRSRRFQ